YHAEIINVENTVHRIHPAFAFRKMIITGLPLAIIFTGFSWFYLHEYASFFLLWMPFVYLSNMIYQKNYRLYLSEEAFQVYSGVWGRENKVLQWYKIQKAGLSQSPWQRRNKVANVIFYTAGGYIR